MALGIFCCCKDRRESVNSCWEKGNRNLRLGGAILDFEPNSAEKQRAYQLVSVGLRYLKLANAEQLSHKHKDWDDQYYARQLMSSFYESSTFSPELKNYLIQRGVIDETEYQKYKTLFQGRHLVWEDERKRGLKCEVYRARQEIAIEEDAKRKERQAALAERQAALAERNEREKRREIEQAERKEEARHKEQQKRQERDDYEKAHPEVRYQREAAEAAREQVELLREQVGQENERTRLLRGIARDTESARKIAESTRKVAEQDYVKRWDDYPKL